MSGCHAICPGAPAELQVLPWCYWAILGARCANMVVCLEMFFVATPSLIALAGATLYCAYAASVRLSAFKLGNNDSRVLKISKSVSCESPLRHAHARVCSIYACWAVSDAQHPAWSCKAPLCLMCQVVISCPHLFCTCLSCWMALPASSCIDNKWLCRCHHDCVFWCVMLSQACAEAVVACGLPEVFRCTWQFQLFITRGTQHLCVCVAFEVGVMQNVAGSRGPAGHCANGEAKPKCCM